MKDILRRLWLRRPRLGRRGKIVRNLLLTLPFLIYLWGEMSYPLPTLEQNFRRLERENLSPPTQIVHKGERLSDRLRLVWPVVVGEDAHRTVVGYAQWGGGPWTELDVFPRSEDPTLVPLIANPLGGAGQIRGDTMLLLHVPGEAVRGELAMEGVCEGQRVELDCELFPVDGGHWAVRISSPALARQVFWYEGFGYRLTLYNAQEELLLERTGKVPNKS